ncbi:MAG: hypothetical protein AAGC95_15710 [Pseudomonadota bacterium]
MKAATLFLLRLTTGALLIIWGALKVMAPNVSVSVSDRYYSGALSAEALQTPLGIAQCLLGLAVILGLLRVIVYPVQAIVLGLGLAAIWQYIADPFGLYLLDEDTRQILFFPSSTVFIASLIMLAFKEDDRWTLDGVFGK